MKQIFQIILFFSFPIITIGQQKNIVEPSLHGFDTAAIIINKYIENPENEILKHSMIEQLSEINYQNIEAFSQLIEKLDHLIQSNSHIDKKIYREILRVQALINYKNKNYQRAHEFFKMFFSSDKDSIKPDTSYVFEYSKYLYTYYFLDKTNLFIQKSNQAIKSILEESENNIEVCRIMINLSQYYNKYRVLDSSRYFADMALTQYQNSQKNNFEILSEIYKMKGMVETYNENHELSKIYYDQAIEYLLQSNHSELELASLYNKKGLALLFTKQPNSAIKYFNLVIQIYLKEFHSNAALGNIYYNLGMAYYDLEDYKTALNHFKKSLKLDSGISNYFSHRFIANTYFSLDSIDLARNKYEEVLNYLNEFKSNDTYQIAFTKLHYGQLLVEKTNDTQLGEKILAECIDGFYKHFNGSDINLISPLNILGTYYIKNNQIDRGLDSLQKAISIAASGFNYDNFYQNPDYKLLKNNNISNNTLAWKAYGLYLRYLKTADIEDLNASQNTYKFYIYCTSENRKYFDNSSSLLTSSQVHYVYNEAINVTNLLYNKTKDYKYLEDIFGFIEGKKSFTLFQSLKILEQKKLLNIPKELIEKEDQLKYQLNLISEKIIAEENGNNNRDTLRNLRKTEVTLNEKLDSLQNIFKEQYSGFYELKYGFKDLTIPEIQNKTPDKTAFVNYSISDSLLHTICITHDTLIYFTQRIDYLFFERINTMVRLLKNVDTDHSYLEFQKFSHSSYALYQKLIQPIESFIKDHQLIIIPDDELNYISFDALIEEFPSIDRPDYRELKYLIKKYKSNVANSMQIYFNMKQMSISSNNKVFAFAPHYPLFPDTNYLPKEYDFLRPLDYAELEIQSIEKSMNTVSFSGKEATKESFSENAKKAGILHLAMHTIINDQKPLHSKFLFTYISNDKTSVLNTYELLSLNLNAELAVLSGCSTGDGKLMKGEGVMSLSSGFQFAGVPAIVMSLWEVNDRFGSLVIQKFYDNLANGINKKQALYQAKKDVLNQGNALYAHPYYWAGLTLMGDESKIQFINRYQWDKLVIVFAPILFIIVVLFQTRKKWILKKT